LRCLTDGIGEGDIPEFGIHGDLTVEVAFLHGDDDICRKVQVPHQVVPVSAGGAPVQGRREAHILLHDRAGADLLQRLVNGGDLIECCLILEIDHKIVCHGNSSVVWDGGDGSELRVVIFEIQPEAVQVPCALVGGRILQKTDVAIPSVRRRYAKGHRE
jgi:hypothetical protein